MRRFFIIAVLISIIKIFAWEWIPFDRSISILKEPEIRKISSSSIHLSYSCHIPGMRYEKINTDWMKNGTGEEFALFSFPEFAYTGEIGEPKLPVITQVVEIPHGADVSIRVLDSKYKEINLSDFGIMERIIPVLAPVPKIMGEKPIFSINDRVYSEDRYYPDILSEIESHEGFARGHRLITVRLFPLQYNPKTGNIKFYTDIEIELKFIGGDISGTLHEIHKNYSPDYEKFIDRLILNPDVFEDKDVTPLPVYYDIFYTSDFREAADTLYLWKKQKGFKVRMWDASNWSTSQIEDTIDAQIPLATYLVILADPNASNPIPSGSATEYGGQTDLYYSETDGIGYLPDIYKGRISVKTEDEAMTVVKKVLRYEKANFGSAGYDWLKRATFIAGYDPSGNQSIGRATNRYCFNLLTSSAGYDTSNVDTLVFASGEQEGRVVDEINEGNIWTVYTGHGGRREWSVGYSGDFTANELINLTNNLDMYTMPFGHCCNSNDFDYSSDCFGETWPKLSDRGGISYFGSVPGTFWDEDDWLQRRYFDAIYTDSVQSRLYEVSRFTDWALYWIENNTATSLKKYYFEGYHVMGDPSIQIWTDIPDTLLVIHKTEVVPGPSNFNVEVLDNDGITPIEEALVCCWIPSDESGMQTSGYTDSSGTVTLNISPSKPDQEMLVTVTKHDYFPSVDNVYVDNAAVWTILPESVLVNTPTNVSITVQDTSGSYYPDVEIHIFGYGFEGYDTTDLNGEAVINVVAPYGEIFQVAGKEVGETWTLFKDSLFVYGAGDFSTANIGAYSDTIGVTDGLMPGISGTIWGHTSKDSFTLYIEGCGIDTSSYTVSDSVNVDLTPLYLGEIRGTIAKSGYDIYQDFVNVAIYKGILSGYVLDSISSDSIIGAQILGYVAGIDTVSNNPVFDVFSDSTGFYIVNDSIFCGDYDVYTRAIEYESKYELLTLKYGDNFKNILLETDTSGAGLDTDKKHNIYSMIVDGIKFGRNLNIAYTLPELANLEFRIYDCTGRIVKQKGEKKKAGSYRINIDMNENPSGIYFIHMKANDKEFMQKVVLIR